MFFQMHFLQVSGSILVSLVQNFDGLRSTGGGSNTSRCGLNVLTYLSSSVRPAQRTLFVRSKRRPGRAGRAAGRPTKIHRRKVRSSGASLPADGNNVRVFYRTDRRDEALLKQDRGLLIVYARRAAVVGRTCRRFD